MKNTGATNEARLINLQKDACPACLSVTECLLGTHGWLPILDRSATDYYNSRIKDYGPYYSWYKCHRQVEQDQLRQAKAFIPERFAGRTWESFDRGPDTEEAYRICKEYADSLDRQTDKGLLICGPVGTGKTHLAVAILSAAFKRDISAALVYVPDLLAELRQEIGKERILSDKVRSRRFLVLDDLGAEKPSEWTEQELTRLINHRYEHMLPTVVTTNLSQQSLADKLGARGADRLKEMCKPVIIRGSSRRLDMRKYAEDGKYAGMYTV